MTDQIKMVENLSENQLKEGKQAYNQFKNFSFGVTVTSPELALSLATQTSKELEQTAGIELFVSAVDFKDAKSVNDFVTFWEENAQLLKDLDKGYFHPKDIKARGHNRYPVFLFIDPTNLDELDEQSLGEARSKNAFQTLRKICKYGRVNIAITPGKMLSAGTAWSQVPNAYCEAVKKPESIKDNKMDLARYLYSRSGIKKLGLEQRVEDPFNIFTPTKEALEKLLIS